MQAIETEGYQPVSLPGVVELENYLPARLLNPKVRCKRRRRRAPAPEQAPGTALTFFKKAVCCRSTM